MSTYNGQVFRGLVPEVARHDKGNRLPTRNIYIGHLVWGDKRERLGKLVMSWSRSVGLCRVWDDYDSVRSIIIPPGTMHDLTLTMGQYRANEVRCSWG